MNYKQELDKIDRQLESQKIEKAKLEERKRQLEVGRTEILKQLEEEQIDKDKLGDIILDLDLELSEGVAECQQLLS